MKIIITFSILCALFLSNSHSKNNWKQISGRGASSQSFFNQNDKAKVIWGYENGLWRVACYDRCTELTDKYLPLENLKDDVGYWVNFESVAPTEDISTGLVGEWDITLKSSSPWDNTSAVLNVSNQYSTSLKGHPIVISEFGVKGKVPVTKFEISNIQVLEDTLLQIDYMFYREVPKTQEELTEALPEEIRAELIELEAKRIAYSRRKPYIPTTIDLMDLVKANYHSGEYIARYIRDSNGSLIKQDDGSWLTEAITPFSGKYISDIEVQSIWQRIEELKETYAVNPIKSKNEYSASLNVIKQTRCIVKDYGLNYNGMRKRSVTKEHIQSKVNELFPISYSASYNRYYELESESGHTLRERVVQLEQVTGTKAKVTCEPNDDYYNLIPSFKSSYFNILKNESKRIILQVRDGVFLILKKK